MAQSRIFNVENMSFKDIRENKILTKFPDLQYPICVGPYTILFRRMRFYLSERFLSLYI